MRRPGIITSIPVLSDFRYSYNTKLLNHLVGGNRSITRPFGGESQTHSTKSSIFHMWRSSVLKTLRIMDRPHFDAARRFLLESLA